MANERLAVSNAYSSKAWVEKVKKMSDRQVAAIYLRLKSSGKIQ